MAAVFVLKLDVELVGSQFAKAFEPEGLPFFISLGRQIRFLCPPRYLDPFFSIVTDENISNAYWLFPKTATNKHWRYSLR